MRKIDSQLFGSYLIFWQQFFQVTNFILHGHKSNVLQVTCKQCTGSLLEHVVDARQSVMKILHSHLNFTQHCEIEKNKREIRNLMSDIIWNKRDKNKKWSVKMNLNISEIL